MQLIIATTQYIARLFFHITQEYVARVSSGDHSIYLSLAGSFWQRVPILAASPGAAAPPSMEPPSTDIWKWSSFFWQLGPEPTSETATRIIPSSWPSSETTQRLPDCYSSGRLWRDNIDISYFLYHFNFKVVLVHRRTLCLHLSNLITVGTNISSFKALLTWA